MTDYRLPSYRAIELELAAKVFQDRQTALEACFSKTAKNPPSISLGRYGFSYIGCYTGTILHATCKQFQSAQAFLDYLAGRLILFRRFR